METQTHVTRWIGILLALVGIGLFAAVPLLPREWVNTLPALGRIAPNSLLAFILSGIAIALGPSRAMSGVGVLITLLAAAVLLQIIFSWYPGDGSWRLVINTVAGNRMSLVTSLAFLALGTACLLTPLLGSRSSIAFVLVLLGGVFSVAMIGVAAHLMGIPLWNDDATITSDMSLPTALGLLWASFGMFGIVVRSKALEHFYEEHPDRRILVRAVLVATMLVLAAGFLTGAIVARNAVAALGRTLAEIRDTNALLLKVAIHDAERQGRLVATIAQASNDTWVLSHLAETGTDSVLAVWEDMPRGGRRMLSGNDSGQPEVAIPLDSSGVSQLMWDGRWIVEVRNGRFVAQIGVDGLEQLFKYAPELGTSSDVVISAKHGHGIVFFPTRLQPKPFYRESRVNSDGELFPASLALEGRTGTVIARDYRGQEVFAAIAPIAEGKLGIVQKIDTTEVLTPLRAEFWKALSLTLMLLGIGGLLLRRYVHPLVIGLRETRNELAKSHVQLQLLAAHMEEGREEEQKRIAREIHDEMGGTLAAIDMHVYQLSTQVGPDMEPLASELRFLQKLGASALASMRKVVSQLRPTALDDLGLSVAIDSCAEEFESSSGIPCERNLVKDTSMLTDSESTTIFRILQEALNNVAKHSRATKASVIMEIVDESLALHVRDNGQGFAAGAPKANCFGLIGMRERARMIGAQISINSLPGYGTTVTVSLRWQRPGIPGGSTVGR